MKETNKSRSRKIEILTAIIEGLNDQQLDALLILLEKQPLKEYRFTDAEMIRVEESFARYDRGEVKGMSAEESVERLTNHLNKIRNQK